MESVRPISSPDRHRHTQTHTDTLIHTHTHSYTLIHTHTHSHTTTDRHICICICICICIYLGSDQPRNSKSRTTQTRQVGVAFFSPFQLALPLFLTQRNQYKRTDRLDIPRATLADDQVKGSPSWLSPILFLNTLCICPSIPFHETSPRQLDPIASLRFPSLPFASLRFPSLRMPIRFQLSSASLFLFLALAIFLCRSSVFSTLSITTIPAFPIQLRS